LGAGVADLLDPLADEPRDVDVDLGRDLARDDHEAGGDERLAGDAPVRIAGEHGVEDRVGDLVGDLVRVALGDRLGREVEAARSGDAGAPTYPISRKAVRSALPLSLVPQSVSVWSGRRFASTSLETEVPASCASPSTSGTLSLRST